MPYYRGMTKKQLEKWIKKTGGPKKAAELLGVNRSTLWRWLQNPSMMSCPAVLAIEANLEK
jgi:DNA-binding protein Fis